MVALLSQEKLPPLLEGAPPVRWGGWGDLPPPPPPQRLSDRYSYRLLSPVATVVVAPSEAPPEITLRFQHTPLVSEGGPGGGNPPPKCREGGRERGGLRIPKGHGDTCEGGR